MRIDRQIETARRDIRAEVRLMLSSSGFLEFRFGRLCPPAHSGLGHRASG
jgi:hypothetical protein